MRTLYKTPALQRNTAVVSAAVSRMYRQLYSDLERTVRLDECMCVTVCASATGSADTVNVVVVCCWLVKVNHVGDIWDIQTTSGNISCNHHSSSLVFELTEGFFALRLGFVAMDCDRRDTCFIQAVTEPLSAMFGAREHENLIVSF